MEGGQSLEGDVAEVKIVLASVVAALALYQVLAARSSATATCASPSSTQRPASATRRAVGDPSSSFRRRGHDARHLSASRGGRRWRQLVGLRCLPSLTLEADGNPVVGGVPLLHTSSPPAFGCCSLFACLSATWATAAAEYVIELMAGRRPPRPPDAGLAARGHRDRRAGDHRRDRAARAHADRGARGSRGSARGRGGAPRRRPPRPARNESRIRRRRREADRATRRRAGRATARHGTASRRVLPRPRGLGESGCRRRWSGRRRRCAAVWRCKGSPGWTSTPDRPPPGVEVHPPAGCRWTRLPAPPRGAARRSTCAPSIDRAQLDGVLRSGASRQRGAHQVRSMKPMPAGKRNSDGEQGHLLGHVQHVSTVKSPVP